MSLLRIYLLPCLLQIVLFNYPLALADTDDSILGGGFLRSQIQETLEYYFNTDRLLNTPSLEHDPDFEEQDNLYYNYIPLQSGLLLQGKKDLIFRLDKKHIEDIDDLLIRVRTAKTTHDDEDNILLDKIMKDTTRLKRLVQELPNRDTSSIQNFICDYRLDRFFYGLSTIQFKKKKSTEIKTRKKRAGTRQTNQNSFRANYLPIEFKYEACLVKTDLDFHIMDKKLASAKACSIDYWILLTGQTVKLMTDYPPATPDEDELAFKLVISIVYAMPLLNEVKDLYMSNTINNIEHITKPASTVTLTDAAALEAQFILTMLPFMKNFEAQYLVRARRGQIKNKTEYLDLNLYLRHFDFIKKSFPTKNWADDIYKCHVLDFLTNEDRETFLASNKQLAKDMETYQVLCCTNTLEYTCPLKQTYRNYRDNVEKVRGTILLSWIPETRKQQLATPATDIWPDFLIRTNDNTKNMIPERTVHFSSTPFKVGRHDDDITEIRPESIELNSKSDIGHGLSNEIELLAGNLDNLVVSTNPRQPAAEIPSTNDDSSDDSSDDYSDDSSDDDTNTVRPTSNTQNRLEQKLVLRQSRLTERPLTQEHGRSTRDNDKDNDNDNVDDSVPNNDEDQTSMTPEQLDAISDACYESFNGGNPFFTTGCNKLFHTDHTIDRAKLKLKNEEQDLQLYSNLVLDIITHVTIHTMSIRNVMTYPTLQSLGMICEDTSHVKYVTKSVNNDKLIVYTYTQESTLYLPTVFCSQYYCHELVTENAYIRTKQNEHCYAAKRIDKNMYQCQVKAKNKPPPCFYTHRPTKNCRFRQTPNTRISSVYHLINDGTALLRPSDNVLTVNSGPAETRINNLVVRSQEVEESVTKLVSGTYFLKELDIVRYFDDPNSLRGRLGKLSWIASNLNTLGWIVLALGTVLFMVFVICIYRACYNYCKYKRITTTDMEMIERPQQQEPCTVENTSKHPVLVLKKMRKNRPN